MKKRLYIFGLMIYLIMAIMSCNQIDVYESHNSIPNHKWNAGYFCKGTFKITDTLATYNLYVVLRHTDKYQYNNIWLNIGTQSPGKSMVYQKMQLILGSDAKGWQGVGMDDIWECRKKINEQPCQFKNAGDYRYELSQIMRDDPLNEIINVGFRVEKAEK